MSNQTWQLKDCKQSDYQRARDLTNKMQEISVFTAGMLIFGLDEANAEITRLKSELAAQKQSSHKEGYEQGVRDAAKKVCVGCERGLPTMGDHSVGGYYCHVDYTKSEEERISLCAGGDVLSLLHMETKG